jgi:hypothetical protein
LDWQEPLEGAGEADRESRPVPKEPLQPWGLGPVEGGWPWLLLPVAIAGHTKPGIGKG